MTSRSLARRSTFLLAVLAYVSSAWTQSQAADLSVVTRFSEPAKSSLDALIQDHAKEGRTVTRLPAVEGDDEAPIPTFNIRPSVLARLPAVHPEEGRLPSDDMPGQVDTPAYVLAPTDESDDRPHETQRERLLRILSESAERGSVDPADDPHDLAKIQGLRLSRKVAQQADTIVENAIRLARLGATHSARAEFTQALRLTAQALDAQIDRRVHSRALSAGLIALDEAEDFAHPMGRPEDDLMLEGLVAGHKTPILKELDLEAMPALVAMQKYYEYAYRQLCIAGGEEAPASKAIFALAKIDDFQATTREVTYLHKAPRLIALYQSALTIFPQNSQAANELGVQLAEAGQLRAAGEALRHGLRMAPTVTLWRNLAEVHQRLGEHALARQAQNESRLAAQIGATPAMVTPQNPIQWVSPEEFARSVGPQNMASPASRESAAARRSTIVR